MGSEPQFIEAVRRTCLLIRGDRQLAPLAGAVDAHLAELSNPVCLAVSGHVSAGKSTMINALLGRRLAETGRGETTTVNAWFVRGAPERVTLRRRGGEEVTVPLPVGEESLNVPGDLDRDALQPVTYFLDDPLLDDLTLIDTPGLFSPNDANSERTAALIDRTQRAARSANALLYLTEDVPGSASDDRQLAAFQSLFGGLSGKSPINAVLVLSKIDMKWDPSGEDPRAPFDIAQDLIAAHGQELWKRVWTTTPFMGQLAELPRTGRRLTGQEVEDLLALQGFPHRRRLLESSAAYARAGVPAERGLALQRRLGSWGMWRALGLLDAACPPPDLLERLADESGFPELMRIVAEVFRARADLVRAESVISAVKRDALVHPELDAAARSRVLRHVEEALLSDGAAQLREVHALRVICDETDAGLRLSEVRRHELRRLLGDGPPAERLGAPPDAGPGDLVRRARKGQARWRAVENSGLIRPALRDVAELAGGAYAALARDLERSVLYT